MIFATALVVFLNLFRTSECFRVCEYCCAFCDWSDQNHTACQYPRIGYNPDFCNTSIERPMTDYYRRRVLKMHNMYRQQVANGEIKMQPKASNLLELNWDDELEFLAKRWNDQCFFEHDPCRHSYRFRVGQNIALSFDSSADAMIQYWFDEYLITPLSEIVLFMEGHANVTLSGVVRLRDTGHYTQMVWADSYLLGCTVNLQNTRKRYGRYKVTIMCDYAPSGNIEGEPTYAIGPGCSGCHPGTYCSTVYPGLCALRCSKIYPNFCSGFSKTAPTTFKWLILFFAIKLFVNNFIKVIEN